MSFILNFLSLIDSMACCLDWGQIDLKYHSSFIQKWTITVFANLLQTLKLNQA
ncbi:unnamed protein product [Paramecium octaurelia]|uniref:Uncharacterized protein n=1 Tax=Paramecium octaurelia TaxID=43137 RepID=A0A8S1TDB6_PAROT|nr:unnamed protein product [Paramecium octaurelia]